MKQSQIDTFISGFDKVLRTLTNSHQAQRNTPQPSTVNEKLNEQEQKKSACLMRVNHCGEVCAQALYQGQALTAKHRSTQASMQTAANEEIDHLVWCEERIKSLNTHTSYLNPLWYGLSFSMGAATGLLGDKISLGFVAATEEQVCKHLEKHILQLPENDTQSKAVLEAMLEDERRHGEHALDQGGIHFPKLVQKSMTLVSQLMTKTSYYI